MQAPFQKNKEQLGQAGKYMYIYSQNGHQEKFLSSPIILAIFDWTRQYPCHEFDLYLSLVKVRSYHRAMCMLFLWTSNIILNGK